MDKIEFERRLKKLALREGMTFATFIGLGEADRAVLRATILSRFEPDIRYSEREVNERLKAWLAGAGSMIETDHVVLRRLLVDTRVLGRTADCKAYWLQPDAMEGLPAGRIDLDADAIVAGERHRDASRRAARKAAWLGLAGSPGSSGPA